MFFFMEKKMDQSEMFLMGNDILLESSLYLSLRTAVISKHWCGKCLCVVCEMHLNEMATASCEPEEAACSVFG